MTETAPCRFTLLAELENRQEEVLRQLDELNQRIERAVAQNRGAGADREAAPN